VEDSVVAEAAGLTGLRL